MYIFFWWSNLSRGTRLVIIVALLIFLSAVVSPFLSRVDNILFRIAPTDLTTYDKNGISFKYRKTGTRIPKMSLRQTRNLVMAIIPTRYLAITKMTPGVL